MNYLLSTIGRKQMVGVAGIGLSLFVLMHMAGNLLIFLGPEAYNMYAHKMVTNPFIYLAEAGLLGIFLLHMIVAIALTIKNKKAKGSKYAASPKKNKTSFAAKTMWFQGVVIVLFIIWHLITFKFGPSGTGYEFVLEDGKIIRDLFKLLEEVFMNPFYVVSYIIVVILLGMHLGHGFASSLQTLGLNGETCDAKVKCAGKIYAAIVTFGFISQPLYIYFIH